MPAPGSDQTQPELAKRLLARAPVVQNACDLDLISFLHRHPRTLLTSEQLAGFVGYNLREVAKSLDTLIEAGLLERTAQRSAHAAHMFLLRLEGPHGGGVRALLELGSTREGRERILKAMRARGSPTDRNKTRTELRLVQCV